ncbi:MAG: response regulator transcription factor [Bifidobacteriaceae bacterium]|nr:response regulator transcription factor [Bifidobacteriaceae bacterium]
MYPPTGPTRMIRLTRPPTGEVGGPRTGGWPAIRPGRHPGTPLRGNPAVESTSPYAGLPVARRASDGTARGSAAGISVAIVEPETLLRSMMADAVSRAPGMRTVVSVGSCREARATITPGLVDVVAIEVDQPDGNGATLALELQRADSRLSIVTVTRHDARGVIESTRRHLPRPWGYVSKRSHVTADDVVNAIRQAAMAPDNTPPPVTIRPGRPGPFAILTPQQLTVLRLISEGFTNTQVADRLGLSRRTVENHLLGIYRAFDISSEEVNPRVSAVLRYLSHSIGI